MKKMMLIVLAFTMALGFTQCKKEQPSTPAEGELVPITLTVDGANNSKAIVDPYGHTDPDYATVTFEDGDEIQVCYNKKWVGSLTYANGAFNGNVNVSSFVDNEPLRFYFLSGFQSRDLTSYYSCSFVISNQSERFPVVSYAPSREVFTGAGTYSAKLQNKISIMKFNVDSPSNSVIYIKGMNNKVTVNFGNPDGENDGFSYSMDGEGLIMMPGKNDDNETWAIVLPQEALPAGDYGSVYSADGHVYKGSRPAISAIGINQYLSNGVELVVASESDLYGPFTVNDKGDKVFFSKGNLLYNGADWFFDDDPLDYNYVQELFAWGTSGYNHGAVCYQPESTSPYNENYYAYGDTESNLYDQSGQADWGYNAIAITPGYDYFPENSGWRTLSYQEWEYLLHHRNNSANPSAPSYALASIVNMDGLVLLPDGWDASVFTLNNVNPIGLDPNGEPYFNVCDWEDNVLTTEDWSVLEASGAVFLPKRGHDYTYIIDEETGEMDIEHENSVLSYWTASSFEYESECAMALSFESFPFEPEPGFYVSLLWPRQRQTRCAVRLVRSDKL